MKYKYVIIDVKESDPDNIQKEIDKYTQSGWNIHTFLIDMHYS